MPHEDYCYALERENHALNEKYESLRQQLDGWIAANSPNGWIDNLRQQLVTLKTELKSIGEAIDDPRTDLTMTMSEVIIEQKKQLAAALAAIKSKDAALQSAISAHRYESGDLHDALAIQPDDSALKVWLGEPRSYLYKFNSEFGDGTFWSHRPTHNGNTALEAIPLYAPKWRTK